MTREEFMKIAEEMYAIHEKKNADYGNSVQIAADIAGMSTFATRMLDKVLRLITLTTPGISAQVEDETLRDTFVDLANYGIIATNYLDSKIVKH